MSCHEPSVRPPDSVQWCHPCQAGVSRRFFPEDTSNTVSVIPHLWPAVIIPRVPRSNGALASAVGILAGGQGLPPALLHSVPAVELCWVVAGGRVAAADLACVDVAGAEGSGLVPAVSARVCQHRHRARVPVYGRARHRVR